MTRAYLSLKGSRLGPIIGGATDTGFAGWSEVYAHDHLTRSAFDPVTGTPGRTIHAPFVLVKPVDSATPSLHSLIANNETLSEWLLVIRTPGPDGAWRTQHEVRLENARIASLQIEMLNNRLPELKDLKVREKVAFAYDKVRLTWTDGGVEYAGSWPDGT